MWDNSTRRPVPVLWRQEMLYRPTGPRLRSLHPEGEWWACISHQVGGARDPDQGKQGSGEAQLLVHAVWGWEHVPHCKCQHYPKDRGLLRWELQESGLPVGEGEVVWDVGWSLIQDTWEH